MVNKLSAFTFSLLFFASNKKQSTNNYEDQEKATDADDNGDDVLFVESRPSRGIAATARHNCKGRYNTSIQISTHT